MTNIEYTNNKKLQIEFTKKNLVEDSGIFLIKKFLEKIDFEYISKNNVSLLRKEKGQKKFSNYELFLQEIYMTLTGNRSLTNIKHMKENKMYDFIFDDSLAGKSTLNNFQNSFDIKNSFELSELTVELIKQNPQFLFSKNGMIILDSDAVDIETHGKQEGSAGHGYYRQNMYYPDVVTVFDGLLPLIGRLRPGNCHGGNGDTELLHEALTSLEKLDCFNWNKVLLRGDSAFGGEKKFSYAENNGAKFLVRIASNNVLKNISFQSGINLYSNENEINVIKYKAESWSKERFIIVNKVKKEGQLFADVQFFCTNLFTEKDLKLSQKRLKHKLFRIIDLYHKRGTSEHIFHDLKDSFQAGQTSNHNFYANSYRFQVSLISMQIYVLFRELFLNDDKKYRKAYYKTIFNGILSLPGILVKHARKIILKIPEYSSKTFYFMKILKKLQT